MIPNQQMLNPTGFKKYQKKKGSKKQEKEKIEQEFKMIEQMMQQEQKYNVLKFQQLHQQLKSSDVMVILNAIMQLSTELTMTQEQEVDGYRLDRMMPELIACLQNKTIPDIKMYACICINHILDIIPQAIGALVDNKGVKVLCNMMNDFDFIDVAENALKSLEKVSMEYPDYIMETGTLPQMMGMIDFFVTTVQKSIIKIIRNVILIVPSQEALDKYVLPIFPQLLNYLKQSSSRDGMTCEVIIQFVDRITKLFPEDFKMKKKYLMILAKDDLIVRLAQIFQVSLLNPLQKENTKQIELVIRIFNKFAYYSSNICLQLFDLGLINFLEQILLLLNSQSHNSENSKIQGIAFETVSLINSILSLRESPSLLIEKIAPVIGIRVLKNQNVEEKVSMFKKHKNHFNSLLEKVFPKLISIFESNSGLLFKYLNLICMEKILSFGDKEILEKVVDQNEIAFFMYRLLLKNDMMIISIVLQGVENLILKLPSILNAFSREGVIQRLQELSQNKTASHLKLNFLVEKKKVSQAMSQDFFSIHRMMKDKNMDIKTLNKFITHLGDERHLSNSQTGLQETFQKFMLAIHGQKNEAPPPPKPVKKKLEKIEIEEEENSNSEMDFDLEIESEPSKQESIQEEETIDKKVENIRSLLVKRLNQLNLLTEKQAKLHKNQFMESKNSLKSLQKLSDQFFQKIQSPEELGVSLFEDQIKFIKQFGKITIFEQKSTSFFKNLLDFLFSGLTKPEQTMDQLDSNEEAKENSVPVLKNASNLQKQTIAKRLFIFQTLFIQNNTIRLNQLTNSLQDILTGNDKLTFTGVQTNINYLESLKQNLVILANREKFQFSFIPGQAIFKKRNRSHDFDQDYYLFEGYEDEDEMFNAKQELFLNNPQIMLSIENFGSLNIIEQYLLNKFDRHVQEKRRPHHDQSLSLFEKLAQKFKQQKEKPTNKRQENITFAGEEKRRIIRKLSEDMIDTEEEEIDASNSEFVTSKRDNKSEMDLELELPKLIEKHQSLQKPKEKRKRKKLKECSSYLTLEFYWEKRPLEKSKSIYELLAKFRKFIEDNPETQIDHHHMHVCFKLSKKAKKPKTQKKVAQRPSQGLGFIESLIQDIEKIQSNFVDKNIASTMALFNTIVQLRQNSGYFSEKSSPLYPTFAQIRDSSPKLKKIFDENFGSVMEIESPELPKSFQNQQITAVISKHYEDLLAVAGNARPVIFKNFCEKAHFLVGFQARLSYFLYGTFQLKRVIYKLFQQNKSKLQKFQSLQLGIGVLKKKKIRVSRNEILQNSMMIFECFGPSQGLLEFEYINEEGTGLGPTMEYYTIVIDAIHQRNIMRKTTDNTLFPEPIMSYKSPQKRGQQKGNEFSTENPIQLFRTLGTLVARALIDNRTIDLPFSEIFWDVIFKRRINIESIRGLNIELYRALKSFKVIANQAEIIKNDITITPRQKNLQYEKISIFKGCKIEDLGLTFLLPGYEEIELCTGGKDRVVKLENLSLYISLVVDCYVSKSIEYQTAAFIQGFNLVFPIDNLLCFRSAELDWVICGQKQQKWSKNELMENINPQHGYSIKSKQFVMFIEIVMAFTPKQQKEFLLFTTGAGRLPYGGFKSLQPRLTIVKKHIEGYHPDEYLPSVMTCQNYIKLPAYSEKAIMKKRILYAIKEGQKNFTLS